MRPLARQLLVVFGVLMLGAGATLAHEAVRVLGRVDILMNVAGGSRTLPVDAEDARWLEAMTLNFFRVLELTHAILPAMCEQGWGRIVNFTGTSEPQTLNAASSAKAAVHTWSKGLSREIGPSGVTINCIQPGRSRSEQIARMYPTPEAEQALAEAYLPLRRFGQPDEAAVQEGVEESFSELQVWMDWAATLQSLETTKAVLPRARTKDEAMEDFAVHAFLRNTGTFVLSAGLHPLNWNVPKFEIGYWCRTSMQGKGYVTEVVRELTAAAFHDLAAKRVEIRCDPRNHRSRRVAERAGFHQGAELRWDDRANDGSLSDTIVYVLLAEDFHTA